VTGKAFATRVRRITDHLNDKISHIRSESRNIVMRVFWSGACKLMKNSSDEGHGFSRAATGWADEGFSP
jgi:hypothetical protein